MVQPAVIRQAVDCLRAFVCMTLFAACAGLFVTTMPVVAQEEGTGDREEFPVRVNPRFGDRRVRDRNQPQVARKSFRENATLPFDSQLLKRFETVNDLLADERWTEAIAILQDIAQSENKGLVRLKPGVAGGVSTYLNVTTRCNVLLSRIPAEGRKSYRNKFDPQAKRWFENWQRTRDPRELLRIVHQSFVSSYGDDALLALGEEAWDRGEFSAARSWWEQLVPLPEKADPAKYPAVLRYPDAELDQPTILARIVLCSILERDLFRATEEVSQFSERFPTDEGWVAGERGPLAERLKVLLEQSRSWSPVLSAAKVETFAMSPARNRRIPESVDVGSLRWVRPLRPNLMRRPVDPFPFQNEPLSYFPVVYDETVLVNDSDSIRAWNLLTGEPAWQSSGDDPAAIYSSVPDEPGEIPERVCVGVPYYTMTISDGRLYARMGSAVNCPSNQQARDLTSDLVCLDLTKEGKLVWKISARELFPEDSWRFEGSPVIVGGRAYCIVCRRHPQLELMVICLDASAGRLLWRSPVGGFRNSVDESVNRVSHLLLTAGGGRLFLSTDTGAIIALNDQDGRLEWAITYESRSDESVTVQSDPNRKGLLPPLFHRGMLFVAPNDADFAWCVKADSGQIEWTFPYLATSPTEISELDRRDLENRQRRENQWHHLLGVAEGGAAGRLIVSGNSLWAIDIHDGTLVWSAATGRMSGYGRGVLANDLILLPGRESIDFVAQKSGELVRRFPLKTPDATQQGGNLTLAGGILLVAQPNRLSAYCEYSVLKERIEREMTQQPDNTSIQMQLAEIDAAEGNIELAAAVFVRILDRKDRSDPNDGLARRKLTALLQNAGKVEFDKGELVSARDYWMRADSVAEETSRRVELRFDLARVEESLGNTEAALAHLQLLLNDERLAGFPREFRTVGQDAIDSMTDLISRHGRHVYREIEATAIRKLDELKDSTKSDEIKWLIQSYPHADVIVEARRLLAEIHQQAGEFSQAYAILNEFRRNATDEQELAQSTVAMIDLVDAGNQSESALRLGKSLAHLDPEIQVTSKGVNSRLGDLIAARMASSPTRSPRFPFLLERNWTHELTAETRVVMPEDQPPADEFASILTCEQQRKSPSSWIWRCLDSRTGKVRWEDSAPHPALIACWANTHLLIGTAYGWEAREPDKGRRIWLETGLIESTPLLVGEPLDVAAIGKSPAQFDEDRGLRIINPDDGQLVAAIRPPGRLSKLFRVSSIKDQKPAEQQPGTDSRGRSETDTIDRTRQKSTDSIAVILQTLKPARTWLATANSPHDRWDVNQIQVAGEPWQAAPIRLCNRVIGVNQQFHLVCKTNEQGTSTRQESEGAEQTQPPRLNPDEVVIRRRSPRAGDIPGFEALSSLYVWRHRDPTPLSAVPLQQVTKLNEWEYRNFSLGNAIPFLWPHKRELTVIADGTSLVSFDPLTGRRKWSTPLADFPIQRPDHQVTGSQTTLYAASQGTLRGISLVDGHIRFESYLGDIAPQWRSTLIWSDRSTLSGIEPTSDTDDGLTNQDIIATWPISQKPDQSRRVIICCGVTGEIVQSLSVDGEPKEIAFSQDGRGIVWTEKSLTGLQGRID